MRFPRPRPRPLALPVPAQARRAPGLPVAALLVPAVLVPAVLVPGLLAGPAQAAARAQLAPAGHAAAPGRAATTGADRAAAIRSQLHAVFAASTARAVSVAVDVDGLGRVYRQSSGSALAPASTEKLFTSLALLTVKGAAGRQSTLLRGQHARTGTHLPGDLWLQAGGDPYLTRADLDALAAAVRNAGIRKIDGSLVVDDLRYDAVRHGAGWKSSFVPEESGPLDALAVDRNGFRTDKTYLADPGIQDLSLFRSLLSQHGVAVSTALHRGRVPSGATTVASHVSATTASIISTTMKGSVNFGAEQVLKELGAAQRGSGTSAAGAQAVHDVLQPLHVSVGTVADGSGLSSRDRQSAESELSLLAAVQSGATYDTFQSALPTACVDGTLQKRMCGTSASGVVHAKTGTLDGVNALTGWTTTSDGHTVRFAFLLGSVGSSSKATAALDRAAELLSSTTVDS